MLALQLIAFAFLAVSAVLMFGPQLVVYGTHGARRMARDGQFQFVGGCFSSLTILIFAAPHFGAAFQSGGSAITLAMVDLLTMSFSPV